MKNTTPLSNDWLYWDPESIHCYPHTGDTLDFSTLKVVSEKIAPRASSPKLTTWLSIHGVIGDILRGIVAGAVAGAVLTLLIAFFPNTTRAEGDESATRTLSPLEPSPRNITPGF